MPRLAPLLLALAGCVNTQPGPLRPAPGSGATLTSAQGPWSLRLTDERGRALPTHLHEGGTWVEGTWGQAYRVAFTNQSPERVEVVVTVDGRDVITGQVGDFGKQRGYIVEPYGQLDVEGFRQSRDAVATFRFTSPGDAYSSRMGTPGNLGVVGVAVFREAPPARRPDTIAGGHPEEEAAAPKASADGYAPGAERQRNLGTQYGERRHSPTVEVGFQRASSSPEAVLALYYDDRAGLSRRGVLGIPPPAPLEPSPFPDSPGQFAPPPP